MSVFTSVSSEELQQFLSSYSVGELIEYRGIEDGIENSNFFVTTTRGEYVLTLFERVPSEDIPYFMALTAALSDAGVACAHPVAARDGSIEQRLNGKDAALVSRLKGKELEHIEADDCFAVGLELARLHLAGMDFPLKRENAFGLNWFRQTIELVSPKCDAATVALMSEQLADFESSSHEVPTGTIHADVFTDNVLFHEGRLSGIIDFYYACNDSLVYDLAITLNDWCKTQTGTLIPERVQALTQGYESARPLNANERAAMPVMLRRAAFRFFMSRLKDKVFPREGEMVKIKDPEVFRNILLHHLNTSQPESVS